MNGINISNSTVIINTNAPLISDAKDVLLHKLYWARHKQTIGGYTAWLMLLDMYYSGEYRQMRDYIKGCTGKGGATRSACIRCLDIIIGD